MSFGLRIGRIANVEMKTVNVEIKDTIRAWEEKRWFFHIFLLVALLLGVSASPAYNGYFEGVSIRFNLPFLVFIPFLFIFGKFVYSMGAMQECYYALAGYERRRVPLRYSLFLSSSVLAGGLVFYVSMRYCCGGSLA